VVPSGKADVSKFPVVMTNGNPLQYLLFFDATPSRLRSALYPQPLPVAGPVAMRRRTRLHLNPMLSVLVRQGVGIVIRRTSFPFVCSDDGGSFRLVPAEGDRVIVVLALAAVSAPARHIEDASIVQSAEHSGAPR
jgi:hypothetical protein